MAKAVDSKNEDMAATKEAFRRYPFGYFYGDEREDEEDTFFAHYKHGHGRRARSLRRAAGWPMRFGL